jgi:signal transduction histidine kinase/CheY-like chemotaxis protein
LVDTTIVPFLDANKRPFQYLAIRFDVTDIINAEDKLIKAKELAEESNQLKTAFLANMSHEIRTPMNGILGFTNILKEPNLSDENQQQYIKIIDESGIRLLSIINDIIDISKIESKQMEVSVSETNINDQIEYIYNFFKLEVANKGILLGYKNGLGKNDAYVKTDSEKLYAVLINLVKNAIKFCDNGTIDFGYTLKTKDKSNTNEINELEFYVKDSGVGIPEDRQDAIFDRFIQADISDKRAFQGAGLGLSISKAFVEMLGGKIWVESKVGVGSSFYFTIPYDAAPKGGTILIKAKEQKKSETEIKNLKIVIVEDDPISKLLMTKVISPFSREIIKVNNGYQAIEVCQNNPDIDLIMMDINMPGMSGYEATSQIRLFNKNVIIIAQTANALSSDRTKAINSGCNDYISKPIDKDKLMELIQKYFA